MSHTPGDDAQFMRQAIALALEGVRAGGGPFGCVIVQNGRVVGRGHNRVVPGHDPTAHAEVEAIRDACGALGTHVLSGCTLYTSCEPCPMCLGAVYWARVDRIVCAATRDDAAGIGFDDAKLYREIPLPPDQRELPLEWLLRDEAQEVFRRWMEDDNRTPY